jgi:dnd system-associated protein 4
MTQSINRNTEHAETVKVLTNKDPSTGIAVFPTIKALQCFAAVLGFSDSQRKPLERNKTENIEWHTFENGNLTDYIYLIALAEENDVNILKSDIEHLIPDVTSENMIQIFEEYANRGLEIITSWLHKTPTDLYGTKALLSGMRKKEFIKQVNSQFKPISL